MNLGMERIYDGDAIALFEEIGRQIRTDETSSACYEDRTSTHR